MGRRTLPTGCTPPSGAPCSHLGPQMLSRQGAAADKLTSSVGRRSLEKSLKEGHKAQRLDLLYMDGPIWLQWPIFIVWCAPAPSRW